MSVPMRRPRIKSAHLPVRHGSREVHVGGVVHGLAHVVEDPDGWAWALMCLLNGTRSLDEVTTELCARFPHRSRHEAVVAVRTLYAAGHLEDAAEPMPAGLTSAERERYSRNLELFTWMDRRPRNSRWEPQMALKDAKVVVLGLGGVGGAAALSLTVSGVGHVHCVDRDVVDPSNLGRQFIYLEEDLYTPKAEAAVRRLRERNSDILVTGDVRDLDGPDAVREVVGGFDVVLLTADRPADIRSWTNRVCHRTRVPWVLGGYHGPLSKVAAYQPGTGPCYDCARTAERERLAALPPRTEWTSSAEPARPQASSAITAGLTGIFAAEAVIALLTGIPALPGNRISDFNFVSRRYDLNTGPEAPHPRCSTCGDQA